MAIYIDNLKTAGYNYIDIMISIFKNMDIHVLDIR